MDNIYIATFDEYCGIGETLADAFNELKVICNGVEFEDVNFFKGKKIKATFEIKEEE